MLLLVSCSRAPVEYHQTIFMFGTLVEVEILGQEPEQAARAVHALEQDFQRMHRDWHAWQPGGELVRLNRHFATGKPMQVTPSMLSLLKQARTLYRQSDGLFNPAIGGLIDLWGFHADTPLSGPPPMPAEIKKLVEAHASMGDLKIGDNQVSSRNASVQLDLGGFAKGYALNSGIQKLRKYGFENAIVNAGGDLCVAGQHNERPWRIGIRHPEGKGVIASLEAEDGECVLTSGNYERYREYEGVRYAHILDPRTGYPVQHVASATVIHTGGGVADAAATALSVAGPGEWRRIAKGMGLKLVMLVDEQGRIYLTSEMSSRVQFEGKPPEIVEVFSTF